MSPLPDPVTDSVLFLKETKIHSSFKPLLCSDIKHCLTTAPRPPKGGEIKSPLGDLGARSWLYRKLKKENLIIINGRDSAPAPRLPNGGEAASPPFGSRGAREDYYITADPLFYWEYGKDLLDTSLRADTTRFYRNTRGFLIRGNLGSDFSFETSFLENQAFFPAHIHQFMQQYQVSPGHGRVKPFKNGGYDFAMASGYASYATSIRNVKFNISFGNGKHFIGNGYRSLFLSDNSFNYPYLRAVLQNEWFQYTCLYGVFQNMVRIGNSKGVEGIFKRKIANIHYVSLNLGTAIQFGIYEAILMPSSDSLGRMKSGFFTFNPVIGLNTARYGFRAIENSIMGINLLFKPSNHLQLYSQIAVDDLRSAKYALQGGVKALNPFDINYLSLFSEINYALPSMYSHPDSLQAFTHYNQPLAHPLGASFVESVSGIFFRWRDFFISTRVNFTAYTDDSGINHFGKNIFRSDLSKTYSQNPPEKSHLVFTNIEAGYLVNPSTQMNLVVGAMLRNESNLTGFNESRYLYIAFRTSFWNTYYDF